MRAFISALRNHFMGVQPADDRERGKPREMHH